MRNRVIVTEVGGRGPRVLLLAGIGARGAGFAELARLLTAVARPLLVEYPEGALAGCGAGALATDVLAAAGPVDAVVGSSFGGMVGAHLAARGAVRALALVGSFTDADQLGVRGRLIGLMGPIAVFGRPGPVAAAVAARRRIRAEDVQRIVPTTPIERLSVVYRSLAARREPAPSLRASGVACLCIHGDADLLVPVSVLPRVAATLPDLTPIHVLRGAGHVPYYTHAEECARLLMPWLEPLAAAA